MYYWVLNYAKSNLGINPSKIILSGDSAGGFMCVAVTILSIIKGIKVPHAMLLNYPALSTDIELFHPSMLISLDEMLLS